MLLQTVCYDLVKRAGALVLGTVILWQVAEHAGVSNGQAIIHVSAAPVDVTVDDAVYHVEFSSQTPVVCELGPGRHKARMLRDGQVLYEEEFTIVAGQDVVLSAWDGYDDGRSPQRGELDTVDGKLEERSQRLDTVGVSVSLTPPGP